MADTTTNNYALVKPEVGASADSWGAKLNGNMDALDAVISAIAAKHIGGLTLSTAGSSNSFGVAAGAAGDASGALMVLAAAYTKTTSAWAVGSGNGALDTGAIANNAWYHAFLIKRADTGIVDVLVSTSAIAPTLPANYMLSRRIGAMKTDGSAHWTKFTQVGDQFLWATAVIDINASPGPTPILETLSVPTGVLVTAQTRGSYGGTSSGLLLLSSPLEGAHGPDNVTGARTTISPSLSSATCFTLDIVTNTNAQIYAADTSGTASCILTTFGWEDMRGKV